MLSHVPEPRRPAMCPVLSRLRSGMSDSALGRKFNASASTVRIL